MLTKDGKATPTESGSWSGGVEKVGGVERICSFLSAHEHGCMKSGV